eukprot:1447781-Prymnesium_polylepis.1
MEGATDKRTPESPHSVHCAPHQGAQREGWVHQGRWPAHHLMPLDGGGLVRCGRMVMEEGTADAAHLQPRRGRRAAGAEEGFSRLST